MKRWLRRAGKGLATILGLVALGMGWVALRDLPQLAPASDGAVRFRGAFHVHSDSSRDGRMPADEYLEAARRVGLDFVIFAEHNTQPAHPSRPGGPVAVPGTELSTRYGHLVFLRLAEVPPEGPLRTSIGLVDSLSERGAFTVLAHPASPRRPWLGRIVGIDGLEILSTSDDARIKGSPITGIFGLVFAYPTNPGLALSQLYRRDVGALRMWDRLEEPNVVGLCGTDAHGWVDPRWNLRTWEVVFDPWPEAPEPLTAEAVVERLASGRFSCVAGLVADSIPGYSFRGVTRGGQVYTGESVPADAVEELEIVAPTVSGEPAAITTVLRRDGAEVFRSVDPSSRFEDPPPGTYRVEFEMRLPGVFLGGRDVPVLYSNRIRLTE